MDRISAAAQPNIQKLGEASSLGRYGEDDIENLTDSVDGLDRHFLPPKSLLTTDKETIQLASPTHAKLSRPQRPSFLSQPCAAAMALFDSPKPNVRLATLAGASAVGLALAIGTAAGLGFTVTPALLQLTISGGSGQGIAAQLYLLGDALTFLFGQGGGVFGNLATVATMAALTRAVISSGDQATKRNSWAIAQTTLGLCLSPLASAPATVGVPVIAGLVGATFALGWVITQRAMAHVEPSERSLLTTVAFGVALAPMATKLSLGQPLVQVLGDAAQIPIVVLAGIALWDFWQHFQEARRSPASSRPELDLRAKNPHCWPALKRPDLPALANHPAVPQDVSQKIVGLERIPNLEVGIQSALIDWYGHSAQRSDRRRRQWLFCGPPGVGKKTTIRALQNYFDALLLETSPEDVPPPADEAPRTGHLSRLLERAEYLAKKNPNTPVILAIHHVEGFLASEQEGGAALSATNSSDLLKALEFNEVEDKRLPPVMIICTSSQPYQALPARMRDRMEERYLFNYPNGQESATILAQKIRLQLSARPSLATILSPAPDALLPASTLASCGQQAADAFMTGSSLDTYAWRLINRVASSASRAQLESVDGVAPRHPDSLNKAIVNAHTLLWPEFVQEKREALAPASPASV